jgi:hypothetical protein
MKYSPYRNPEANINGGETTPDLSQANPVIDLDRLANADESSAIPGSLNIGNLPNLDPPNLDDQNNNQQQSQQNNQNQNQQQNNQEQQQQNQDEPGLYDEMLTSLSERYGDKFRIDMDGLTEDNVMERIEDAIYNARGARKLHPEVEKIQKAIDSGMKIEDYYKSMKQAIDIKTMASKDLVKLSLSQNYGKSESRPNGWDEAKINATVDKMESSGILDVEAERIREAHEMATANMTEQLARQANEKKLADKQKMDELRTQGVEETIKFFNTLNEVNGIQISQSDKAEFAENFRLATTPDPKTGRAPLYDALQSNENMAKVFWFLSKGDQQMRTALTLAKEGAKNDFLGKLDKTPRQTVKSAPHQTQEINLNALVEPANT